MPDMFKITENYLISGYRLQLIDQVVRNDGDVIIRYSDGFTRTVKEGDLTPAGAKILLGNSQ